MMVEVLETKIYTIFMLIKWAIQTAKVVIKCKGKDQYLLIERL